jgi:hypothetical protein
MKALIIEEKDVKVLYERLELKKLQIQEHGQTPLDQIHRQMNYVIRNWFEEQGM